MTSSLSSDAARGWTTRVPHGFIGVGLPATVALLIIFVPSGDSYVRTVDEAASWKHLFVYSVSTLGLAAAVLAWAAPRVCLGVFVVACGLAPLIGGDPSETTAALIWGPVAALDLALALRQQAIAAEWPREHTALADPTALAGSTGFWRWESLGLAVLAAVGAAVSFGWWVDGRSDLIAFDERAVPGIVTITKVDTELDTVYGKVDKKVREFWVDDASAYKVGDELPVRLDPEHKFSTMGPDDADPKSITDIGALSFPLTFLALLFFCTPRQRDRQTMRAAGDKRPVRALVQPSASDEDVVEILTADGRVIATAGDVTYVGRPGDDEPDWEDDDPLLILGEGPASIHVDLSGLPAGTNLDDWLSEDETPAKPQHRGDSPQPALVFGLERYGRSVVIQLIGDAGSAPETLVPARPIRDPFTMRSLFWRVFDRRGSGAQVVETREIANQTTTSPRETASGPTLFHSLLVATRTFGPLVGLVAVWFAVPFLNEPEDPSIWDVLIGAVQGTFAGFAFAEWFSLERPLARLGRRGVVLPGSTVDRLLPDHRLVGVEVGKRSATITLRDPDERVGIIIDPESAHATTDLAELRDVVDQAMLRNRPEPAGWTLPRLQPAPGGALVVISALVGASAIFLG